MSGKHEHSDPPGEKPPSVPPAGEPERGRAIAVSPPPTDDLDSEWDSGPADPAAQKPAEKPSVRPGSVVVRTNPPPPMTVAAGTDAGNTLLGVAPPAVALQVAKAAVTPTPPASAVQPEVATAPPVPSKDEPVPEKPKVEPAATTAAEKSEATSEPRAVATKEPAKRAPAARGAEVGSSPDSVAASSSDRRAREAAEEPVHVEPQRSSRGLWIAAAAAVVIFGLWYGLRVPAADESAAKTEPSSPAAVAHVSKAEPAPPDPAHQPTRPVPAPAEPATAVGPAPNADLAAPPSTAEPLAAAADGKKVVIVKVRPADARFFYKGKKMGGSPMRVELAPGEKRAFEVGHPSFVTRKVVIDGSEPEVLVGLHPKSASAMAQPKVPAGEPAEARP